MKKDQKTDDMKRSTKVYELIDEFVRLFYCLLLCLYTQEIYFYNQKKGEQP